MSTSRTVPLTSNDARVIIVGCGLAGLGCASSLVRDHGLNKDQIVLLEGSDRIGGRIMTDKSFVEGFSVSGCAEPRLRGASAELCARMPRDVSQDSCSMIAV